MALHRLGRAIAELRRRGGRIGDALVAQPSPLGWGRIDLGDNHVWSDAITPDAEGLMPLARGGRGRPPDPAVKPRPDYALGARRSRS